MFHEISGYVWIITIWISKDRHICQQLAITFFLFFIILIWRKTENQKKKPKQRLTNMKHSKKSYSAMCHHYIITVPRNWPQRLGTTYVACIIHAHGSIPRIGTVQCVVGCTIPFTIFKCPILLQSTNDFFSSKIALTKYSSQHCALRYVVYAAVLSTYLLTYLFSYQSLRDTFVGTAMRTNYNSNCKLWIHFLPKISNKKTVGQLKSTSSLSRFNTCIALIRMYKFKNVVQCEFF